MPIYEYWCARCKTQFDKLRPIAANDAEVKCPECGSNVKRMLSVVAAVNKSTGQGYSTAANGGGCACGRCACGCGHH